RPRPAPLRPVHEQELQLAREHGAEHVAGRRHRGAPPEADAAARGVYGEGVAAVAVEPDADAVAGAVGGDEAERLVPRRTPVQVGRAPDDQVVAVGSFEGHSVPSPKPLARSHARRVRTAPTRSPPRRTRGEAVEEATMGGSVAFAPPMPPMPRAPPMNVPEPGSTRFSAARMPRS